ncbi:MAG: hypothetical protein AAGA69_09890, partial [Pseudomonadota bacterium]
TLVAHINAAEALVSDDNDRGGVRKHSEGSDVLLLSLHGDNEAGSIPGCKMMSVLPPDTS